MEALRSSAERKVSPCIYIYIYIRAREINEHTSPSPFPSPLSFVRVSVFQSLPSPRACTRESFRPRFHSGGARYYEFPALSAGIDGDGIGKILLRSNPRVGKFAGRARNSGDEIPRPAQIRDPDASTNDGLMGCTYVRTYVRVRARVDLARISSESFVRSFVRFVRSAHERVCIHGTGRG